MGFPQHREVRLCAGTWLSANYCKAEVDFRFRETAASSFSTASAAPERKAVRQKSLLKFGESILLEGPKFQCCSSKDPKVIHHLSLKSRKMIIRKQEWSRMVFRPGCDHVSLPATTSEFLSMIALQKQTR